MPPGLRRAVPWNARKPGPERVGRTSMHLPVHRLNNFSRLRQHCLSRITPAIAVALVVTLLTSGPNVAPAPALAQGSGPPARVAAGVTWYGFGFDPARSGVNSVEST